MGSRAAIFIRYQNDVLSAYFDWGAAQGMGVEPMLSGPEAVTAYYATDEPVNVNGFDGFPGFPQLDGGGLLVDVPNRVVIWCAEPDANVIPRVWNHPYEVMWPGWRAYWAAEGPVCITNYLGLPSRLVVLDDHPSPCLAIPARSLLRDDGTGVPVTVQLTSNQVITVGFDGLFTDLAELPIGELIEYAESRYAPLSPGTGSQRFPANQEWGIVVNVEQEIARWWSVF